jgi:saposin
MTQTPVKASPECVLCEFIVRELRSIIGDNATEAQIKAALDKVCNYLPATLAEECESFVTIYGDLLIQMLLSELDPEQICTELGLCGSRVSNSRPVPPAAVGGSELCVVCETIVQYLEALLEQNATVTEIEAVLDKICDYLPATLKPKCDAVVQKYGPLIVHYISTSASPQQVCTLAKACDQKTSSGPEKREVAKKAPVLGLNECTWGPSYWCASRENADKCNAVDHCKRNVWNKQ